MNVLWWRMEASPKATESMSVNVEALPTEQPGPPGNPHFAIDQINNSKTFYTVPT